jgi:hypothetical protein
MQLESENPNKVELFRDLLEGMRQKERELLEKKIQLLEEDLKRDKRGRMCKSGTTLNI